MDEMAKEQRRIAAECVDRLTEADQAYDASVSQYYDEVVLEVIERVNVSGSVGKLDVAALTAWKRLRADTPWVAGLMPPSSRSGSSSTTGAVATVGT